MPTSGHTAARTILTRLRSRIGGASNLMLGLTIFGCLLILYVATGSVDRDTQSPDAVAAALPAWHFVTAHTLFLDNVPIPNVWVYQAGHHVVSNRQPGVVFFGIPFYWALGGGSNLFSMFPAVVAAATAAAGAVALVTVTIRSYVGTRLALITAAVLGLGTATWSVSADTLWPHGPDQLFLAAAMYFMSRKKFTLGSIAIALAVPVRAHLAVLALVAGIWFAVRRRSGWPLLQFGLPSAAAVVGVLAYNHWMFGAWSLNGGYDPYVTQNLTTLSEGLNKAGLPTNVLGSLFSLDRGLIVWFPVVVVLAMSLRPAWRSAPDWMRISAVGGVLYFLIQMKINYFTGGNRFWSYRLTIETLTLGFPLLALAARDLYQRRPRLSRVAAAAAVYGIGAQAIGAIYYQPDNYVYGAWSHSKLWQELAHGGPGPVVIAIFTVLGMIAALSWRRRDSARTPELPAGSSEELPIQSSDEPTMPLSSATFA